MPEVSTTEWASLVTWGSEWVVCVCGGGVWGALVGARTGAHAETSMHTPLDAPQPPLPPHPPTPPTRLNATAGLRHHSPTLSSHPPTHLPPHSPLTPPPTHPTHQAECDGRVEAPQPHAELPPRQHLTTHLVIRPA